MENQVSYVQGEQRRIVRIVTKRFKSYYLTGGTALSFYWGHRFSEDLDFFTQEYRKGDPDRIMDFISKETGFDFRLEAEQEDPGLIPMKVFFLEYFSMDKVESLVAWYRGFNRMKVKLELMDLVSGVDTAEVLRHLDDEILRKLPDKMLG